ncbi:plasmid replication initiator protein [Pseudonocardia eucalypti]|uniref:Plasmid replication initiator protein n=1 Tax=Pseudonocardia eucalypti TaxID=648755 RepID=A0ABP9PFW3_9PSEU|nr:hypothetical protein [Pseudonocardia eucalypti]
MSGLETLPRLVPAQSVEELISSRGFAQWRTRVEAVSGCARPVQLAGSGGESVFVACKNRRASMCEPCSRRYAGDTFHLVRSGLCGGKGVPESVTEHVRVFTTLTAPSFGPVHNQPRTASGRLRPCACGEWHHDADSRLGGPLDPDSYDYVGAVLWQAHAPELWRRFTIAVVRHLAGALGMRVGELRRHLRVSYVKVAEYQRRGLVHFHAVIRVDGPDGPGTAAPGFVTSAVLLAAIRSAASAVTVWVPGFGTVVGRELGWGEQVDADPIAAHDSGDPAELASDRSVAGYVAKYATKGTGATAGVDRRIQHAGQIGELEVSEHHRMMIATAWELGGVEELAGLNLRKWAHMLGFRGHFLTKSRRYSVTFGAIRQARKEHRQAAVLAEYGIDDTPDVAVTGEWVLARVGYRTDAEREYADVIARRIREERGIQARATREAHR